MKKAKQLIRKKENTVLAGVCGSFAEYFGVKVKIIRLIYIVLTVLTFFFPGILLYLFLMLIIPREITDVQIDEQVNELENS